MIGDVEYHLPNQGKGWKLEKQISDTPKQVGETVIYLPENATTDDSKEFFGVNVNKYTVDLNDNAAIQKGIQDQFPDQKVTINMLDKNSESILFEWTVTENGKEQLHGWTRAFSVPKETVMLTYLTDQIDTIKDVSPRWIETLKQAKKVQK